MLLVLQAQVRRDQNFESLALGSIQQVTVAEGRSTLLVNGRNFMPPERFPQRHRGSLIKKNAHLRRGQGAARGVLQDTADLIECHAREPSHKLGDLCSVFQIFEQSCNRYAAVTKYPRPAEKSGVALDRGTRRPVNHE